MEKYFATKPSNEIGQELESRIEKYVSTLEKYGHAKLWRKCYRAYHNSIRTGGQLNRTGEQNEYTSINVNHFRNLLQHLIVMTTSQRPSFEARASNSDYKSQAQTILAQGLLDFYMREKRLERKLKDAVELAMQFGEGFIEVTWKVNGGEIYGEHPETGALIYEGDIDVNTYSPFDIIRDPFSHNSDVPWTIVRRWENRFDLAAEFPDLAEKIISESSVDIYANNRMMDTMITEGSENIPVYHFYHKPTAAVPKGRFVKFITQDTILLDGPLPYRNVPLYRIAGADIEDSPFGHTVAYDLLPLQEAIDGLYSTVVTNQSTFGVQNVLVPRGANLNHMQLSGGLNLIEYDANIGEPKALNLTDTPAEIFNFMAALEHTAETLSGVNSVSRGNPEASLKSGSALALVQSMSLQFNQGLQQSYAQLVEDVGTAIIELLRDYAKVPRIAMIAGRHNRGLMKEFTGDDLAQINRVVVDMGNPLTKTVAGKVNLAEQLLQNGLVKTPEEYIMVLNTGRLDPMIEGETAELLLIKSENEKLNEGVEVPVLITDDHRLHILEHRAVAASPEARDNPELVAALNAHLQQHIDALKYADPVILQLFGQPNVGGGVSQAEAGNVPAALDNTAPLEQAAESVNMPSAPRNALTNESWTPETGGML